MAINPLIIHEIKHMIPCYKELDKRISLYYYISGVQKIILGLDPDLH